MAVKSKLELAIFGIISLCARAEVEEQGTQAHG
jgi:hypothetical protein